MLSFYGDGKPPDGGRWKLIFCILLFLFVDQSTLHFNRSPPIKRRSSDRVRSVIICTKRRRRRTKRNKGTRSQHSSRSHIVRLFKFEFDFSNNPNFRTTQIVGIKKGDNDNKVPINDTYAQRRQ